jgi:plasmid stability protein
LSYQRELAMGDVLIRDVPDDVRERLKRQAAAEKRSFTDVAREALARGAPPSKEELFRRADEIRAMTPTVLPDSTPLIREDRDNAEPYR